MPDLPDGSGSAVAAVDARALFHLRRRYGQATELQSEDRSPRAMLQAIVANQGGLMEGGYERSLEASVTRIEEMAHKLACGQQLEECEDGCSDKNATKAVQSRKQSMSASPAGEVQRGRRGGGSRGRRRRDGLSQGAALRQVMVRVARETLANPLVVSCALGALYRGAFGTWLPESKAWVVFDTTKAVGLAFMPLVLFLAGASLVGSLGALNSVRALSLPLTLVACKSLLLPALGSLLAAALAPHASVFAFEYCALSTATSAYIIVKVRMQSCPRYQARGFLLHSPCRCVELFSDLFHSLQTSSRSGGRQLRCAALFVLRRPRSGQGLLLPYRLLVRWSPPQREYGGAPLHHCPFLHRLPHGRHRRHALGARRLRSRASHMARMPLAAVHGCVGDAPACILSLLCLHRPGPHPRYLLAPHPMHALHYRVAPSLDPQRLASPLYCRARHCRRRAAPHTTPRSPSPPHTLCDVALDRRSRHPAVGLRVRIYLPRRPRACAVECVAVWTRPLVIPSPRLPALLLFAPPAYTLLLRLQYLCCLPYGRHIDSLPPAVPFGTTQELAYTAAYFLAALSIAGCVIAVTVRSRRRSGARGSAVGGADVELSAPPVGDRVTLRHAGGSGGWGEAPSAPAASAHASKDVEARELLKIEACITLVRCLGEAALCMGMRGSRLGLSTGSAQLILLIVALEDGQGVHTFFLFGLSPLVLRAYGRGLRRVQGCVQRAFRRLAPAESPSGADGADGTRLIHTQSHGFISAAAGTTSSPGW